MIQERRASGPAAKTRFIDDYLSYLLSRAANSVSRQFHAQLKPRGMPIPVWRVLATLSDGDGLPITELAKVTLFKQPTLTKVIDRMERQGLVERRPSEADRRKVLVYTTAAGRAAVAPLLVRAKAHEADILGGHDQGEIDLLKQSLHALIRRCDTGR